jgi:ribonuclease Z
LLQYLQLNAREDYPIVYYPRDSGSFPALRDFAAAFDPHVPTVQWVPIGHGDKIQLREDYYVEVFRNNHIPCLPHIQKSLGFQLVQVRHKLKPEFKSLPGLTIKDKIATLGKDQTHDTNLDKVLAYSGDTPLENFEQWDGSQVLIHEATFLDGEQLPVHGEKHSHLQGVLEHCSALQLGALVLSHFSSRYDAQMIDERIQAYCKRYQPSFPVYRILPGQVHYHLLDQVPVYPGH